MTPSDVLNALRQLAELKNLESHELTELLRDGIQAALVREKGATVDAEIEINEKEGILRVTVLRTVVEEVEDPVCQISIEDAKFDDDEFEVGDVLEEDVPFESLGRNAVLAAKQKIVQRVREGERSRIREEFEEKIGTLVTGEVQQIERGRLVIMIPKFREAEALIPFRDQNRREHFHQGDPIRAVLRRLEETPRGPRLILSRADASFVTALFRLEVPEIAQGIVEIKCAARDVGSRTKISVTTRDESVDPVGACVGLRGSRVHAVVNELGGERIDIVPWSPDPERFARLALAPAKVARVFSDPDSQTIHAVVDEDQLSLAIGRNGQNVRLASELTGWKIDLYSSKEWLDRVGDGPVLAPLAPGEELMAEVSLRELSGVSTSLVDKLEAAGFGTLKSILDMEAGDVTAIDGVTEEEASELMEFLGEMTEENAEEEEEEGTVPSPEGEQVERS